MSTVDPRLAAITDRIIERSKPHRGAYLQTIEKQKTKGVQRRHLGCTNLAHAFAAESNQDKLLLKQLEQPNIGIVSAYNDMLSAHQPLMSFPVLIKAALREKRATAQFAGGVPAMCDGVTQGHEGMELSLFSRDTIAMSTAVALSHNVFDGMMCLGVCDKIVPGLVMGALTYGHIPAIFVPAGPMPSGISNSQKAKTREQFANGEVSKDALLESEMQSYHSPGTCTFYGTANSNQMLMEIMGLHIPGAAFVNPNTPLRDAITRRAAHQILKLTAQGESPMPVGEMLDEKSFVNALVGLMATGGSTNLTLHLIAMAAHAGIILNWDDFDAISKIVPQLAKVYPNGPADINQFHTAGGLALVIRELLDHKLLHNDVQTVVGGGLDAYTKVAIWDKEVEGALRYEDAPAQSLDPSIISTATKPFSATGGLKVFNGNLGRAVIKISAVAKEHRLVTASAKVFDDQLQVSAAFEKGDLNQDTIIVLRYQGPKANGMPELHKLTPALSLLQQKGFAVALVTDGRMSGASGKTPAAIHLCPEAAAGGPIAKIRDGDIITLNAETGELTVAVSDAELASREPIPPSNGLQEYGYGRELFSAFRQLVSSAETGAISTGTGHIGAH
jgi:phosphogluconate dehydratase